MELRGNDGLLDCECGGFDFEIVRDKWNVWRCSDCHGLYEIGASIPVDLDSGERQHPMFFMRPIPDPRKPSE